MTDANEHATKTPETTDEGREPARHDTPARRDAPARHHDLARVRAAVYRERTTRGLDARDVKDLRILADFIACWCRGKHGDASRSPYHPRQETADAALAPFRPTLCEDCADLMGHAVSMRVACPMDPKPDCKKCACRCYAPNYQAEIRRVMRYAGMRMILKGRIDYLWHYFF